ncbi:ferritin-like domain-containing protein [Pelomonas sp. SE-A7]|uniref:ferritin-like domain-containing protein n=1 Tax=Pelomonas sp. SE-A7 TaxID=3054953 RepID=UPI00259C7AF5|nr:ferritin-like domain-containing protein [Pelomonas sp. SE-A7]MDM4765372.1 ferritin-like domain-containing protein [Pelomonas sp. SE-A7]
MQELRRAALGPLLIDDAVAKAAATRALDEVAQPVEADAGLDEPSGIPGRPARPALVPHVQLKHGSLATVEGRASLVHSIAHIELNAIDLALDIVWRFPGLPEAFYRDWVRIAKEEALHFTLLRDHLVSMRLDYGSFNAHNALWDMAERTKGDILARIALVPRTLEARGLDASPAVRKKLVGAGDHRAGEILDVILRDEIGHVAAGNRWYRWVCEQRGLDPISTYAALVKQYDAPRLRAPFNLEARRAAGFDDAELAALQS